MEKLNLKCPHCQNWVKVDNEGPDTSLWPGHMDGEEECLMSHQRVNSWMIKEATKK
jgi:pyruvate-formate lyase-activating enzyme